MNSYRLTVIILRTYGLWLLFNSIVVFSRFPLFIVQPMTEDSSSSKYMIATIVYQFGIFLIAGILLIALSGKIAKFIMRDMDGSEDIRVDIGELGTIAYSMIGMVFLMKGIEKVGYQIIQWKTIPIDGYSREIYKNALDKPALYTGLLIILLSLVLIFTPKGILGLIKQTRGKTS